VPYTQWCLGGLGKKGRTSLQASNIEDANDSVCVSGKEGIAISVPAERGADGVSGLAGKALDGVLVEIGNDALALKIPDLDGCVGTYWQSHKLSVTSGENEVW
jgi:hypothetical protein